MLRLLLLPLGGEPSIPGRGARGPSSLPGGFALTGTWDCERLGGKSNSKQREEGSVRIESLGDCGDLRPHTE